MKKKIFALVLSVVLALSMVGCTSEKPKDGDGGVRSTEQAADLMDKDTYLSKVEGLNTATYEFTQVLASMTEEFEEFDFETMIEEFRELREPFIELSEVDNPPEGYEEAHTRMAAACVRFAEYLDQHAALYEEVIDEDAEVIPDEEFEERTEALMTEMEASLLEVGEAMKEVQEIQ